jgi:hypothetical protein
MLPLEAKLCLVTISPTIVTMKPHELRFKLGLGLLTWSLSTRLLNRFLHTRLLNQFPLTRLLNRFILTRLLNRFLLTRLLTLFPKEHFPQSAHELDRILEIIGLWRKHGWRWGCV